MHTVRAIVARDLGGLARGVGETCIVHVAVVAAGSALDLRVSAGAGAVRGWLYALTRTADAGTVGVFPCKAGEMRDSTESCAWGDRDSCTSVSYGPTVVPARHLRGELAVSTRGIDRLLTAGRFAHRTRSWQDLDGKVQDGRLYGLEVSHASFQAI